ncbi:hypothetical protein A2U01_0062533, partial [Trifolium medium]|nr:hypothetical protein [Trifolium medium]
MALKRIPKNLKRSSLVSPTAEISEELRDNTRKQGSSSDMSQGSNPAFVSATEFKIF